MLATRALGLRHLEVSCPRLGKSRAAARLEDPRQVPQRRHLIVDVVDDVHSGDTVERRVGERQRLGESHHHATLLGSQTAIETKSPPGLTEGSPVGIQRRDAIAEADEHLGRKPASGAQVEHLVARPARQQATDHGQVEHPQPARVVAEGSERPVASFERVVFVGVPGDRHASELYLEGE